MKYYWELSDLRYILTYYDIRHGNRAGSHISITCVADVSIRGDYINAWLPNGKYGKKVVGDERIIVSNPTVSGDFGHEIIEQGRINWTVLSLLLLCKQRRLSKRSYYIP